MLTNRSIELRTARKIGNAKRATRMSHSQRKRLATFRAAMLVTSIGLVMLVAGFLCLRFELQPGLDHTQHLCHLWSYIGVCGTFAGCVFTGLGGWFLIFGDD